MSLTQRLLIWRRCRRRGQTTTSLILSF